ncbi:hypothetical protein [Eubacterium oxidoreducens]|uniref:Uncharacterized protein n=1 Tax=Eubacterium oxidoreducens TaxID=1732 RepID=A0A1G6B3X8_EUBOX|nr:hypothetical protein [Eubacterium oxidoreducens]SDB15123.1 hypothetical protein SAMN02910417_01115 [Eubacterium oxidoreducens]
MTREQARRKIDSLDFYLQNHTDDYGEESHTAMMMAIKALEQEPCEDAVNRAEVIRAFDKWIKSREDFAEHPVWFARDIVSMPSVTPVRKKGEWLRMSDLSEQEDDRYRCSRCGNVIHYKDKMNLYTFNSWCGRCGSDNGRKIEVGV